MRQQKWISLLALKLEKRSHIGFVNIYQKVVVISGHVTIHLFLDVIWPIANCFQLWTIKNSPNLNISLKLSLHNMMLQTPMKAKRNLPPEALK